MEKAIKFEFDLELKSSNITETDGLRVLISDRRCAELTGRAIKT